jgi:hypothetical protein
MSVAVLVPNSLTDTNSNVASGAYTDIDSTVANASGSLLTSVANGWTGGDGTASAFSFGLTDLPAAADTITNIELRVRAKQDNWAEDDVSYKIDISGTNAPTDTVTFTASAATSTLSNKTTGSLATTASAANINAWTVRVYQNFFLAGGAPDGTTLSVDEIELIVTYGSTTPAGEPSTFTEVKSQKMSRNPQIARMPTTQEEWNRFVHELGKIVRNEVAGFEPVFTGFSTDPSDPFCWYQRYGQIVYLEFAFGSGTSNSANFTITGIPEAITPSAQQRCLVNGLMESGGVAQILGSSALVSTSGTITFYPLANTNGAWTDNSDKGFIMPSGQYASILYMLRNPDKA